MSENNYTAVEELTKEIRFYPAWDKRSDDPKKNYGIHGVTIGFYLTGEKGTVQFTIYSNWQLKNVQHEIDSKTPHIDFPYLSHKPLPADLGYHARIPQYEGQDCMDLNCEFIGDKCFYDGSSLNAERVFNVLTEKGHDGVWEELADFYNELIGENNED